MGCQGSLGTSGIGSEETGCKVLTTTKIVRGPSGKNPL